MGSGAVIKINYDYFSSGFGFETSGSSSAELFSDVIDPIKKAKSFGRTIKTELQKISMQMDLGSTIGHLIDRDSELAKTQSEISESAKNAHAEQEVVYGALTNVTEKLTRFGETVVAVDRKAASLIKERKLEFNRRYPHLESESEYRQRMDDRSGWEKFKDFGYGFIHGGVIGGFDSLFNGRERFVEHKEAIKQKIAEFATKACEWVKENWEAIVAAIVVVVAAIVCIATFGAGTVFLVAALASFAYAVADKIVAINNDGKGIVETLEANGFHHLSQFFKGFNWGLQITMLISGFKMSGLGADKLFLGKMSWLSNTKAATLIKGFSCFKKSGFWATVGNGAIFGAADMLAVDLAAYGLNFAFSEDAQMNPMEYLKNAFVDTVKDTTKGFVVGGVVAGISYTAIKGCSFVKSKLMPQNRADTKLQIEVKKQNTAENSSLQEINKSAEVKTKSKPNWRKTEDAVTYGLGDEYVEQLSISSDGSLSASRPKGSTIPDNAAAYSIDGTPLALKGENAIKNVSEAAHFELVDAKNCSLTPGSIKSQLAKSGNGAVAEAWQRNNYVTQNGATVHQTFYFDLSNHTNVSVGVIADFYKAVQMRVPPNVDIEISILKNWHF